MISSKGIKTLCYVLMGFFFVAAGVLLLLGIIQLMDNTALGIFLVVLAIVLPFTTCISLYPIFALANIDENIEAINGKVDAMARKSNGCVQQERESTITPPVVPQSVFVPAPPKEEAREGEKPFKYADAVDYVNKRYGLSITLKDDLYTIKEKINSIADGGFSSLVLKRKVQEAISMDDVVDVFVMHKVANE